MIKCWDIDRATEVFTEAFMEASETPVFAKRQEVIYKAIKEIRDHADPLDLEAIMEIIDESVMEYPEIQAAAAGYKNAFNPEFNFENWTSRMSEVDGEETDEEKLNRRARIKSDFLRKKFKDPNSKTTAGRAMLYFLRDSKLQLMLTFMVDREHGYLVSDEDLQQNVKNFKLKLLDTVVDYLKSLGYTDTTLGSTQLFDEFGIFQDILSPDTALRKAIDSRLEIGRSFGTLRLKEAYENFRAEKGNWRADKLFLEAYNAKLLLDDFDAITTMLLGSIVKPGSRNYNRISNETYETKISRATNMWGNGLGDEVENIADLVSDVTQMLIQSSKKYSWKGGPMKDQYLSFLDFNYIMTKIKKLSSDPTSKKIVLDDAFFNLSANKDASISSESYGTLKTLRKMKAEQGYENPAPTFEDVLSFVSDNPQRHLHTIYDLLCNTNILNYYSGINANDKNLIWTVGKELFGSWSNEVDEEGNPIPSRSLYDLHQNSNNDRIFEIVTQIADSMFADLFLQYYEDLEGTLKMRFLQDYAISLEKNQILYSMRQTHGMLDEDRFKRFLSEYHVNIKYRPATLIYPGKEYNKSWMVTNPDYDESTPGSKPKVALKAEFLKGIEVPIGDFIKIQYLDGKMVDLNPKNRNIFTKDMEAVWKSDEFRNFIKDSIGVDFNTDVELASAYEEGFKYTSKDGMSKIDYTSLIKDIANLCGAVVYNQTFNNIIVPNILTNGERDRNKRNVELLRDIQYNGLAAPRINPETGVVEMIADANKEAYLDKLGLANATVHGLLTSALVKTGEGTALAAECLSCLRASHAYQIITQNRRKDSATKRMTYVTNENGFFKGVIGRREFKSDATVKVNTAMSSAESFTASFLGGFVGAFIQSEDTSTINRNGNAFIVPAVYSDKTKLDELAIQLLAYSRHLPGKRFIDMSDSELELEMKYEFGDMYDNIIKNINNENLHFALILGLNTDTIQYAKHPVLIYRDSLTEISMELCDNATLLNLAEKKGGELKDTIQLLSLSGKTADEIVDILKKNKDFRKTLGSIRKNRTISQMNDMMISYNKTHRRKPIEMCEHVHYLYNKDGMLVPNDTLIALWGRFKGDQQINDLLGITKLYPEGHEIASTTEGYFKYEKDLRMALELLTDGVEVFLLGNLSKSKLEELAYLKDNYPEWVTPSYKMAIAKVFNKNTNTWEIVNDPNIIKEYAANPELRDLVKVHPMLSKLNRISYLAAQQYTSSVGGAHYVYKGGGSNILEEEASRWLASNKRNVCYASTVHKYQNKTLNGVPKVYLIAPIEDIKSVIYSIMGDIDSHKPIDGGMFVNPWFPILENNSLGGEAAGLDKKLFGTYYYEKYAAGGIIKTAGFAVTNLRQRRSLAYRNLCKNITDRTWIKEFTAADDSDIEELLDITRDYKGNTINWILDSNGQGTFYQRETDNGEGCGRFKLARIEAIYTNGAEEKYFEGEVPQGWKPTNRYKIYEYPVTAKGEIDTNHPAILAQLRDPSIKEIQPILKLEGADDNGQFLINSNWALYNNVFGGAWSLSLDHSGTLRPSENSVFLMVHALNSIGYTRTIDNNDENFGPEKYDIETIDKVKDLDDLWQPLKYSDISYAPNIGALKSTQMNVNPKEGLYEDTYLNAMNIMMAQLGIQLDKEHHADESEVSMPTQIILACANKGYTIHYSDKLYKSLSTLTEIAISDCMEGIMEIMPGNENKGTLLTEVANIIVDKLVHSQDDNAALEAAMAHLIEKAKNGHKLLPEDVVGLVAWSDAKLYNKIYNDLASHLTNTAIKMKFPGTLAVICPTERVEQIYGDRRLDAYADPDNNLSERIALEIHQDAIRNGESPKQLIFDEDVNYGATVLDRLNLASNIDTQHHYWVEWTYADGSPVLNELGELFRESITIDVPGLYFKLKEWLGYGPVSGSITIDGKTISRKGMKVARVYENIIKGRELGAYNARFEALELSDSGRPQRFCIFDLDSVRALFDYNDLEETFENALDLLEEEKFIQPLKGYALDLILRLMSKKYPESFKLIENYAKNHQQIDISEIVKQLRDNNNSLEKDFTAATFKVCKVLTYKAMEKDLFKISKDYNGERQLYINEDLITVNPETIQTLAYELIMPKVYQSRFGLEDYDLVLDILADKNFFTKRAINKLKEQHVAENCFHYELKNFNGLHVYIYDSRLEEPDPSIFLPKTFHPFEVGNGEWERHDIDGNFMHGLSSERDLIMQVGNLGYEVIVTDNPEYYLENMKYNLVTFSNLTVTEEALQELATNLKDTKSKNALKFIRSIANRRGILKKFKNLLNRNKAIQDLSLEPADNETPEVTHLIEQFMKEGAELHASFNKSLDIIAGRIPALSLQSFMPLRVVAFDNNDINTAYVSTFQLFLLGSKYINKN